MWIKGLIALLSNRGQTFSRSAAAIAAFSSTERGRKVRLVQNHAVYGGMVEAMDLAVGDVLKALDRFGLWAGGWMTLGRLCRCHPFGTSGLDFVPASLPPRARWYLPWRYGRWRGTNCSIEAPQERRSPGLQLPPA